MTIKIGTEIQMARSYSELSHLITFEQRYRYLKLNGVVGAETFGFDRYLNQIFYQSDEWKHCRRDIIVRDNGCDLACKGFDVFGRILIHHINPITLDDIVQRNPNVFDPENLIAVSHQTHLAIHYGSDHLLTLAPIERSKNDTCPWRRK